MTNEEALKRIEEIVGNDGKHIDSETALMMIGQIMAVLEATEEKLNK